MIGIIQYSTNFCWLACEKDLGRLYRRLFLMEYGIKLQSPSNGEHITLTQDYERSLINNWRYNEAKTLYFSLSNVLYTNGNAIWLDVISDDITNFRKELGLLLPLSPQEHFCIGYRFNNI